MVRCGRCRAQKQPSDFSDEELQRVHNRTRRRCRECVAKAEGEGMTYQCVICHKWQCEMDFPIGELLRRKEDASCKISCVTCYQDLLICGHCKVPQPRTAFSEAELKRKSDKERRRCKSCEQKMATPRSTGYQLLCHACGVRRPRAEFHDSQLNARARKCHRHH